MDTQRNARGLVNVMARRLNILVLVMTALIAVGCGKETKVICVDTGVVMDLSGRWNDTDSKLVAETMINKMLIRPRLQKFTQTKG